MAHEDFAMNKLDTSLVCIEFGSIALGYRALKAMTDTADTKTWRVLDASPTGARFMILALGETQALHDAVQKARASLDGAIDMLVDTAFIKNPSTAVTDAIFALSQVSLDEALVIVECSTVSGCLQAAQTLVKGHGLKPIELRIQRSSTGGAYGFFTGRVSECQPAAEDARIGMRDDLRQGHVEILESSSEMFRSFFELNG
jgi:microcompartment protein CcmL/EutN